MENSITEHASTPNTESPHHLANTAFPNCAPADFWNTVVNHIPTAIYLLDASGHIVQANEAGNALLKDKKSNGCAINEVLEIAGGVAAWQKHLADGLKGKIKQFQCHGRNQNTAQRFHAHVVLRQIRLANDAFILISAQDITRFRRREIALTVLAKTDSLTELHNRRYFMKVLDIELKRVTRYKNPLSLMMIDIDHFKSLNDRHGHHIGDEALRTLAATGKKILRSIDIFARLGGEEFAVALPETDLRAARAVAERFRLAVSAIQITTPEGPATYTISVGVISSAPWSQKPDELLRRADAALYAAKDSGRNRVNTGFYPLREANEDLKEPVTTHVYGN